MSLNVYLDSTSLQIESFLQLRVLMFDRLLTFMYWDMPMMYDSAAFLRAVLQMSQATMLA